jgi:hypothetical protein
VGHAGSVIWQSKVTTLSFVVVTCDVVRGGIGYGRRKTKLQNASSNSAFSRVGFSLDTTDAHISESQWRNVRSTQVQSTKDGERSPRTAKDERRRSMSCHDNDPMSTGYDDAHEEGRVPAPNSPNDASDSKPRNDEKRSSSALSATRGALAPGDAPQSHSQRNASSGNRASTIYASVPVESDSDNNRLFAGRDDRQTTGARLQYPLDMRAGVPQGAPAAPNATKRPAEEPSQPAAKRHASNLKVGPLAPPPALPSLPVPAAHTRTPTLPSNNVATALGAANPPVRSVNYHANPLLSGNATSRIACQMCAPCHFGLYSH